MSLDLLNKEQREAVETINGPLLVLAGAGTGKTRVITYRIANMLKNWIAPNNILALTFTNKAAREMKERVSELVTKQAARKLFIGTFHAFAIMILKKETKNIKDLHSGFTIADEVDQKSIFKQVIAELGYNDNKIDINVYRSVISNAKNGLLSPSEYKKRANGYFETLVANVYVKYQDQLTLQNMVDFDDILFKIVELWQDKPEILEKYQNIYKYILVDEFQDTNHVQFTMINLLTGTNNNICVVGDDDQSIYGWRGAKVENILNFPQKFKGTKTIKLEQNYRSTNNILKAANMFIAGSQNRHEKSLWSKRGEGELILIHQTDSDQEEANFVANQIFKFKSEESQLKYRDIAILYRSNHLSRLFEKVFRNDGIPYRLVGSKSFYERREIRDAAAYLKLCVNPKDDQSFLRIIGVPSRGIGAKAIEKLRELQSVSHDPMSSLIGSEKFYGVVKGKAASSSVEFSGVLKKWIEILAEPGDLAEKVKNYFMDIGFLNGFQKMYKKIEEAESRRDNVIEFLSAIAEYEEDEGEEATLLGFLEAFCLADDNDKVDEEDGTDNAVTLLTVHASKGLEFPYVFLIGLEQELFPNYRAIDEGNLDEERRLFYVAITRAKDKLIISNSKSRFKYGRPEQQLPSCFLDEIPEDLIESRSQIPMDSKAVSRAFEAFYDQFE